MSIATALVAAQGRVADCYTAISNKGGTLPATQNLSNMPTAISSIPSGGTIDSLTITPTTSQQTISASGGVDGYSPITVNAVTSSIDANITAGNIKDGVSILGVTGTYSGGGGGSSLSSIFDSNYFVSSNGTITNYISFSDQASVSHNYILKPFATSFENSSTIHNWLDATLSEVNSGITGIKSITKIGNLIANPNSPLLLLNEDTSTEYISFRALKEAVFTTTKQFNNLTVLKKVDLHNANKIALPASFSGLSSFEEIDLSSAEDLTTARALGGTSSVGGAFAGTSITTVSLPALKSTSFGSYTNQFDYMLKNVTGCTVHFPSNLQSVIGSWTSVTSGFGGTNTTVLFDLPATS